MALTPSLNLMISRLCSTHWRLVRLTHHSRASLTLPTYAISNSILSEKQKTVSLQTFELCFFLNYTFLKYVQIFVFTILFIWLSVLFVSCFTTYLIQFNRPVCQQIEHFSVTIFSNIMKLQSLPSCHIWGKILSQCISV